MVKNAGLQMCKHVLLGLELGKIDRSENVLRKRRSTEQRGRKGVKEESSEIK